jgi:hypothetical protein
MKPETMDRLKAALAGRDAVEIGHFQWVNLDMVRAEAGDKWETLKEKVYSASSHFIEKRLSERDVLLRCKGGFILVFAKGSDEEAKERTEQISQQLNLFFLGDRILKQFEISARSESIPVGDLADFMERSQKTGDASETEAPGSPGPEGPGKWRPIDHDARENTGVLAVDSVEKDELDQAVVPSQEKTAGTGPRARTVIQDEDGNVSEVAPGHITAALFSELDKTWDDIVFKPCWDVRFNHITASFCLARRQYRGETLYGRDTLLGKDSPALHRALDHAVVIAAQRGFMSRYSEGMKCAVAIPVNYDTILGAQDRIRYFSILQYVPPRLRKYFYIRVDNIPDGAPLGQMEELFRAMRCFGSNILAKIPLGTVHLSRFENCGITLFSSQIPSRRPFAASPATVEKLTAQATSIVRAKARGCLTQVATIDQLTVSLDAGFEVFSGSVIGGDLKRPAPLRACTLDDIMRRQSDVA